VELPGQSALAEESAEWLIRLDSDTPPTRQQLQALGEWLQRSPAHREELQRLARLWGRMNVLTELAVPLGKPDSPAIPKRAPVLWIGLRAASVVVLLIAAVATGFVLFVRGPTTDPLLATNGLYATAVGQHRTTRLADGSEILLNTNSRISVDYSHEFRQVYLLQGEALFTVAKNAKRPFRVLAGNGQIEAVGTAFSVYLSGEKVNVMVAEGRVALASVNRSRVSVAQPSAHTPSEPDAPGSGPEFEHGSVESLGMLKAGQVATIRSSVTGAAGSVGILERVEPIAPEEVARRLVWREGVLMFSGDTLEDVVKELSRYTTVSIEIPDAAIRNMRIGGRIPVGDTDAMLSALDAIFNVRVTRRDKDRVVLSAASE
jgi:transmembrane sensor